MHLEKILKEFGRKLRLELHEIDWQRFFKQNLLVLNPGYVTCIEKENIDLRVRLPDFILIDVSGYVDIYEIKTPETALLRFDRSHDNYYWSADVGMAISQVENYIDALATNKEAFRSKISLTKFRMTKKIKRRIRIILILIRLKIMMLLATGIFPPI